MACEIQWEKHGVLWKCTGELTDANLRHFNQTFYKDPRFDEMRYQLCDFLGVTKVGITIACVREAVRQDTEASKRNPHVKVALVTDSQLLFGLSRMYEQIGYESKWETGIFSTVAEGRAWVNATLESRVHNPGGTTGTI